MAENEKEEKDISINKKELDLLVANIIPTSRYFEIRFDHLQKQVDELKEGQKEIRADMDRRFDEIKLDMNTPFEQVDRRFEQVDTLFEQVDRRFDQVNAKLDTIIERMDTKIDAGLRENRTMSIRLFTFAMVFSAISMAGLLAKITGLFKLGHFNVKKSIFCLFPSPGTGLPR